MRLITLFNVNIIRSTKGMNSLGYSLKMLWINTKGISANMMQYLTSWYSTLSQLISKAMGKIRFAITSIKLSIALFGGWAKPKPASGSFFNFTPKSLSFIHRWLSRSVYNHWATISPEPCIVSFAKGVSNGLSATTFNQTNFISKLKPNSIPYITHTNIVMDGLLNVKS